MWSLTFFDLSTNFSFIYIFVDLIEMHTKSILIVLFSIYWESPSRSSLVNQTMQGHGTECYSMLFNEVSTSIAKHFSSMFKETIAQ